MDSHDSLLITGAFGFVGKSYLDWLIEQPPEIIPKNIALVSQSERPIDSKFQELGKQIINIRADLTKEWNFEFEPTHVLNFAADGSANSYTEEAGDRYFSINKNLIKWLEGKSVDTLFHASSGACNYGTNNAELGTFTELRPTMAHFVKKRLSVESEIMGYAKVKNLTIARLFSFTGRHIIEKKQYAISNFLDSAKRKKTINIKGNPDTVRSYLAASDMAEWINCSLSRLGRSKDIIQIGSENPITIFELAKYISNLSGCNIVIESTHEKKEIYLPNISQTRLALGVREKIDWKKQIKGLVDLLNETQSV